MGIGQQKTPKAFVKACDIFIYTENLTPIESIMKEKTTSLIMAIKDEKTKKLDIPLLKEAFEMAVREDGWSHLADFGSRLLQLDPGFDPRTYGYKQLSQLIKAYPNIFEIKSDQNEK